MNYLELINRKVQRAEKATEIEVAITHKKAVVPKQK